jgi:uncharacterized SAM-dependent methyltransferase
MLFALATMSGAHVFIDRSAFPEAMQRDLVESLRNRAINHKFHYESYKQAAKWLALHEAYSPARTDSSCLGMYEQAFSALANQVRGNLHLVGLGCGGGQKEAQLLSLLLQETAQLNYSPCDVSLPLVLTSRANAQAVRPNLNCRGAVCDLASAQDLKDFLDGVDASSQRVLTLFGIIPNFEPVPLLTRIAALLRPGDFFLLSGNLAPGTDYAQAVERILPQYDNALTRDWLFTLLSDFGMQIEDGHWNWHVHEDEHALRRITATYVLDRAKQLRVAGESFAFSAGETIRLFYSYRHTPATIRKLLAEQKIQIEGYWLNASGEEGVFLCRKQR